jgi:ribosomal protein S18 acetylase RimI-like enzyme
MVIKIRRAKQSDEKRVVELMNEYDKYEHKLDKKVKIDSLADRKKYFKEIMSYKKAVAFALEVDGKVEGWISGEERQTMRGKAGTIHFFILSEKVRGKGYGNKMMKIHENYFKKKGCKTIQSFVFKGNEKVLGFYKKIGYTSDEEGFMIRKRLR